MKIEDTAVMSVFYERGLKIPKRKVFFQLRTKEGNFHWELPGKWMFYVSMCLNSILVIIIIH